MAAQINFVDLGPTIGALQIGSMFSIFLMGALTIQVHFYSTTFRNDGWRNKALVALIWLAEIVHSTCICYEVYRVTISLSHKPQTLVNFDVLEGVTIVGGVVTFITQTFFALRTFRLLPNPFNYIGAASIFAALIRFVFGTFLSSATIRARTYVEFRHDWTWLMTVVFSLSAAIDVIIAASMIYYLVSQRVGMMKRGTKLIDKLIAYTIRTGLLTSVASVAIVITFRTMPDGFIWLALYICLAKLYSNSLVSALNSRQELREGMSLISYSMPTDICQPTIRTANPFEPMTLPHIKVTRDAVLDIHSPQPDTSRVSASSHNKIYTIP